jgi:hypothetical protein
MNDHEKIKQCLNDFVFNENPHPTFDEKGLLNNSGHVKRFKKLFQPTLSFAFFAGILIALGVYTFGFLKATPKLQAGHGQNQIVQPREQVSSRFPKIKNDHFIQLMAVLGRLDLKIEDVSKPYKQEFDGKEYETITIKTNRGDLLVTDFGREIPPIVDSSKFAYTNFRHLLIGTESQELSGMMEAMADLDQVTNLNMSVSPMFSLPYTTKDGKKADYILRGIKGKVAFKEDGLQQDTKFVAGKVNKYMWYFWGDANKYTTPDFKVVAVEQNTGKIKPVLVVGAGTANPTKVWSIPQPHYSPSTTEKNVFEMATSMEIPKPGKWDLNVFIAGQYEGTIVVNVR